MERCTPCLQTAFRRVFRHNTPDIRFLVVHVGWDEAECDNLAPVIADEVQLETMATTPGFLSVRGQSLEIYEIYLSSSVRKALYASTKSS
jgi:hypothetical protein